MKMIWTILMVEVVPAVVAVAVISDNHSKPNGNETLITISANYC